MGELRFEVFKYPKALLRVLQLLLGIIAFATTCDFSSETKFQVKCNVTNKLVDKLFTMKITYPYNLHSLSDIKVPFCSAKQTAVETFGNYSSSAQFYVFVGVIAMLFCLAAIVIYVSGEDWLFTQHPMYNKAEFIATLVMGVLWFIASVAWADGVTKLKEYSSVKGVTGYKEIELACKSVKGGCVAVEEPAFGMLHASLVAGFGNVGLWLASLWFIYKDTDWFKNQSDGAPGVGSAGDFPAGGVSAAAPGDPIGQY